MVYRSPKGYWFTRPNKDAYRWLLLPYGMYICKNGREVLFNRDYSPIWERQNNIVKKSNMREWIEDIIDVKNFYNNRTPNKTDIAIQKLKEWNIPIPHVFELKMFKENV